MFGIMKVHVPGVTNTFTFRIEAVQENPIMHFLDHQEASWTHFLTPVLPPGQLRRHTTVMLNIRGVRALRQYCGQACLHFSASAGNLKNSRTRACTTSPPWVSKVSRTISSSRFRFNF